jgi:MoaA/NifB/PqqE/SkfB family radical SAM enzyme
MARLVIELTDRCNLRCQHCFDERHAATGELPWAIIETVLRDGKSCGIGHLAFTGGEPTLHRQFAAIVRAVCAADYSYSFVSNGLTFPQLYPLLIESRAHFRGVTFSLDGAREFTHDRLRGRGSYRGVMRAASLCVVRQLPFTLNMVVTAQNRPEVAEMVELAARLGCGGVRFGWLMPTPATAQRGLDLPPSEWRAVEAEIRRLRQDAPLAVSMGPGYYSVSPFFPCAPLELEEYNLDYRGHLTLCCQLSGYAGGTLGTDVVGHLQEQSLAEAVGRFHQRVAVYLADKRARVGRGAFGELDHFPCWYCVQYLDKVPGLGRFRQHPWAHALAPSREGASDDHVGSPGATAP